MIASQNSLAPSRALKVVPAAGQDPAYLSLTLRAARAGIWDWNPTTNQAIWSDEFYLALGLEPGSCEPSYENWLQCVFLEDRERAHAKISEAMAQRSGDLDIEYRICWPDGGLHWIRGRLEFFHDEHGNCNRIVSICFDITERGQAIWDAQGQPSPMIGSISEITERKQFEDILQESEEMHRLFFELCSFGMAYVNPDARFIRVNDKLCEITGYSREELLQLSLITLTHPEDRSLKQIANNKGDQPSYSVEEKRYIRKDGAVRWVCVTARMVNDSIGNPRFSIVVIQDITEQKHIEQALKESLDQLRLHAETMLQGVLLHDAGGKIISVNTSAELILGRTRDEIMGSTWMEMEIVANREGGKMFLGSEHPCTLALRTGQTIRDVQMGVFNPREMDYRWISIDAIPLFQPCETASHQVYSVFTDISERRRFEMKLQQSEARFRNTFENAAIGIAHVDMDGRWLRVNKMLCHIMGYSYAQLMATTLQSLTHPEDLASDLEQTERIFSGRLRNYTIEIRCRRGGGEFAWFSLTSSLARDETGRPLYFIKFVQDISPRKEAEAARSKLFQMIKDTQDRERLRVARDLHDHMGQLLAALKVEIKTLDNPLMMGADRDGALGRLRKIADSVGKELRYLVLELRPADLANQTLTDSLRRYVAEWSRRFQISADFLSQNLEVEQAPTALKNTILRLVQEALTNIVKHSSARNISVMLKQHRGQLQLIIEDDGVGFDPSQIAAEGQAGQKLGLLGMQERVKFYGGVLEIEASPGEGASVFVSLPLSSFVLERKSNEK
jgi:two-component system, NarL family, sensor histidine kinase UhpB